MLPIAGWSSPVARQAHNLKVRGSNPLPATKSFKENQTDDSAPQRRCFSCFWASYQIATKQTTWERSWLGQERAVQETTILPSPKCIPQAFVLQSLLQTVPKPVRN